jgi:Protein of unknown function (DUF3592)
MIVRTLLRLLGTGCLVLGLGLCARAVHFLGKAERAEGVVERVEARDDRCSRSRSGSTPGRKRYDCTRYSATVRFVHDGREHVVDIAAGKRKGHGQPLANADVREGQRLPMTFRSDRPQEAFHGGGASLRLWGGPLLAFVFAGVLWLVSKGKGRTG